MVPKKKKKKSLSTEDFCAWWKKEKKILFSVFISQNFCICHFPPPPPPPSTFPTSSSLFSFTGLFTEITTINVRLLHDQARNQAFLKTINKYFLSPYVIIFFQKKTFFPLPICLLAERELAVCLISFWRFI